MFCRPLNEVCAALKMSSFVHVNTLASFVGQITFFGSSLGTITRIMSRYLHHAINSRSSGKAHVFLTSQAKMEHLLCKDNSRDPNGVLFRPPPLFPCKTFFRCIGKRFLALLFKVPRQCFIEIDLRSSLKTPPLRES